MKGQLNLSVSHTRESIIAITKITYWIIKDEDQSKTNDKIKQIRSKF